MSQLKALTTLNVSWNKELPSTEVDFIIESFPQLTELDLSGLGLTGEHSCSTNRALTTLPKAVPDSIGQLEALEMLNLYGNEIAGAYPCSTNSPLIVVPAALPSPIGNLKALKTLIVYTNALKGEHSRSTSILHLSYFCITDAEKARVRAALPNCKSLYL